MKFRKSLLCFALAVALIAPCFANDSDVTNKKSTTKAMSEIQTIVQNIAFNFETLYVEKVKVHFMVNTANQIVVLRTSSKDVDRIIKSQLNYKELESKELEVNRVYILPITFLSV